MKRSAVTRCCPRQQLRGPVHSWGHVLQPACFLPLSLHTRCTIYFRVRLPGLRSPVQAQGCPEHLLRAAGPALGRRPLRSTLCLPLPCSERISESLARNSLRLCRELRREQEGLKAGSRVNQTRFVLTGTGISVTTKDVAASLGFWFGLCFFHDELCSGRNVAKYSRVLACVTLLMTAYVERSVCPGNAGRECPCVPARC